LHQQQVHQQARSAAIAICKRMNADQPVMRLARQRHRVQIMFFPQPRQKILHQFRNLARIGHDHGRAGDAHRDVAKTPCIFIINTPQDKAMDARNILARNSRWFFPDQGTHKFQGAGMIGCLQMLLQAFAANGQAFFNHYCRLGPLERFII